MKKVFSCLLCMFVLAVSVQVLAQERKLQMHAVAFYNLENLFDTCHDEGKNDWAFGCCGWDVKPSELRRIASFQYVNGVNFFDMLAASLILSYQCSPGSRSTRSIYSPLTACKASSEYAPSKVSYNYTIKVSFPMAKIRS